MKQLIIIFEALRRERGLTFLIIPVALFISVLFVSYSAYCGDPDLAYHTLKTDHFNIHYDKSLQKLAERTAIDAENAYVLVSSSLGWQVEGKTEIRIVDSQDYANGLASPYRYPFIQLFATPPGIRSSLQNTDDWLFSLVLHEYTHEAHIQMQYGVSRIYNTVFGDLYLPNSMQPTWFVEGLAVMMETWRTTRGRIRAPYYSMVLRTHALAGTFQTLAEMSNSTRNYPRGDADYVYGGMFFNYLRNRLGEDVIFKMCHAYAAKPVPYGLNRLFIEVSGVSLKTLYEDFTQEILEEAKAVQRQVREAGETQSERLTFTGENKGHPAIDTSSGSLILPTRDTLERSAILSYPLDAVGDPAQKTPLVLSSSDATVSFDNKGNMFYVRTAPFKNNYRYRDLFVLKKDARSPGRLTEGARVKDAAVSPSGTHAALVTNVAGVTRLELMDIRDGSRKLLFPENDDWHYYCPTFSPDGKTMAFIWRQKGRVDIALMDMQTRKTFFATRDDSIEEGLRFSPDGNYLLYASGVTGITNIFARDMGSGALKQVTNVVSGASDPALDSDGHTLYFLKYYAKGWDLHRTRIDLDALPIFSPPATTHVVPSQRFPVAPTQSDYNPLPTFRPFSWQLSFKNAAGQQLLEVSTFIEDAAQLHNMNLIYNYDFTGRHPTFYSSYAYNGLLPSFSMSFSYSLDEVPTGYLVGGMESPWTRESWSGDIGIRIPIMGLDTSHSLSLGYSLNHSEPVENLPVEVDPDGPLPEIPTQNFRTGVRLGWSYSDLFSGPFSISREEGRSLSAGLRFYHPAMGGNREQVSFYWGWREYREAPWALHHVFALEMEGQAYLSNPNHQSSISAGGYQSQDMLDAVLNEASRGLPLIRGYEQDFLSGDHYQSLRLEYRFPIWQAQLAYETLPVFFDRLYGAVFSDNLLMSYTQFTTEDFYSSVGMELVWQIRWGYHLPMVLRTGYAHGLMDKGMNEFILIVGSSF